MYSPNKRKNFAKSRKICHFYKELNFVFLGKRSEKKMKKINKKRLNVLKTKNKLQLIKLINDKLEKNTTQEPSTTSLHLTEETLKSYNK